MKKTARVFALTAALMMLLTLAACGNYHSRASQYEQADDGYDRGYSASVKSAGSVNGLAMTYMADSAPADYAEYDMEEAAMEAPVPAPAGGAETQTEGTKTEKIIYSANATVETTKYEETIAALEKMIEDYGAWVESSGTSGANYSAIQRGKASLRSASYTIRVPAERFSEMMSSLTDLGNVPYSNIYTENVTSQYYDTAARMRNYEAQEQRLVELLDKAETVSDVIEIENELTEVRYRIESLQTQLNGWDRRVSWSTVYLSVSEVKEYTPEQTVSYGKKLLNALKYGVEDLGDFLIDLTGALPILIVLAAIAWILVILICKTVRAGKTRREKRKGKKAEKTGENSEGKEIKQ